MSTDERIAELIRERDLALSRVSALQKENEELTSRLAEVRAANSAKEVFLSNMSHDIRTPMNAIVGMTALAKKHIDEKARVADALNKIGTASDHLLSLINDVLEMSRIDSGRLQISQEPFFLSDLIHELMTIVEPQIRQKNHTFTLLADPIDAERLIGDPLRLRQIYVNIINNAVKYTPEGGHIDISFSEETDEKTSRLTFLCRDNGIGMSAEFLERIFEPFERAGSTTISRIEGTGLGMSIVNKIVAAMDGTISIDSVPDEGTQVRIVIPMLYENERVRTDCLDGRRFLILEADPSYAERYHTYLSEYGISHTIVPSAQDGLSALTEAEFNGGEYHAVIIGELLENSGSIYDISAYLRKSWPSLTVILARSENWDAIRYRANRSGIHYFIPLPFFRKSLIGGLNEALRTDESGVTASGSPDLTGKQILLVEDNLINLEIAREILSATHAGIDTAENGRQAVDLFENSPEGGYALILMDVQMPVMDGYEATRKIRSLERTDARSVPIYAMTANTFAEDIAKARESGMNGHIAKPIDINALMSALRSI